MSMDHTIKELASRDSECAFQWVHSEVLHAPFKDPLEVFQVSLLLPRFNHQVVNSSILWNLSWKMVVMTRWYVAPSFFNPDGITA